MGPQEAAAVLAAVGPPAGSCPGSRGPAGTPGQMISWVPWAPRLSRGSFTASVVMTRVRLLGEAGLLARLLESGDGGSREPSSSTGQ